MLPPPFTLTEIQLAYQAVLGVPLDKRNFRRRIAGAGILEETGALTMGRGRPAKLYRFREDAVAKVKVLS